MRRTSRWIAVVAVLATLGAGACSSDQPAVCDSLAAVQNSIGQLRNANVSENGLSQLKTDLNQLKPNLDQLYTDAKAQFGSQVEALRAAVVNFTANLSMAGTTPNASTLAATRTAFTAVQDSARELAEAMKGTC